jgi:phage terminase large subunit
MFVPKREVITRPAPLHISVPTAFQGLYRPGVAHKVMRGGRGAAKSWEVARYIVIKCYSERHRVLCAREFQTSMADSVHKLLVDTIDRMGLRPFFRITDTEIMAWATGSTIMFKGLRRNIREIKSTEGVTITWVEEAQSVSEGSWEILIPTVFRTPNAELLVTYNPENASDPVDVRFWQNKPPSTWAAHINHDANPYFPPALERQRLYMLGQAKESGDFAAYNWVWEGGYRVISDAQIFKGKIRVESFTAPEGTRFFYGMDFGFANDPSAFTRSYIDEDRKALMIEYALFGYGVELDELPQFMRGVPGASEWPVKADGSRPETISYLGRQGFNIDAAAKWPGSVEDGIQHLRGFREIVIHERNKEMIEEGQLYAYKLDPVTNQVLPIIVDKFNHGWDAVRYSLDGYIQARGEHATWAALGGQS